MASVCSRIAGATTDALTLRRPGPDRGRSSSSGPAGAANGRRGYAEGAAKVDVRQSFSKHLLVDRESQSFVMLHMSIITMFQQMHKID